MVAYYFLFRIILVQIFYVKLYPNQSVNNTYIICGAALVDFVAMFFEKEENSIAKFSSHVSILLNILTIGYTLFRKISAFET